MTVAERWLYWNDRGRWLLARSAVIALGAVVAITAFVLPVDLHGDDVLIGFGGLWIMLTAAAVWLSGKQAELLAILAGFVLVFLVYSYEALVYTTGAARSAKPISPLSILGWIFLACGMLSLLWKGITEEGLPSLFARWFAWNDRGKWVQARLAAVGLGVGLVLLSTVLPVPDSCEGNFECGLDDRNAALFGAGVLIVLTTFALWVAGKRADVFALLEGSGLIPLGFLFALGAGLGSTGRLSEWPGGVVFVCGVVLVGGGLLLALWNGFQALIHRRRSRRAAPVSGLTPR